MEQNKKIEPLVSDPITRYDPVQYGWDNSEMTGECVADATGDYVKFADHEQVLAKTRAVVQALVDALTDAETTAIACREILPYAMDRPEQKWNKAVQDVIGVNLGNIDQMTTAIALAKSEMNIEPTKP